MLNENYYLPWQFALTQNHTDYSNLRLRDAIIKTEDLIWHAAELGHEVVGITEHESLSNHVKAEKIYKKVKEKYPNFKLILGNEIYLCRNGLNDQNFNKEFDRYYHFCLYAKDETGHQQIREISTRAWQRSYIARGMRRVPTYYQDLFDVIGANPGHVIGSTACLGGAILAGVGTGAFQSVEEAAKMISIKDSFSPKGTDYSSAYQNYKLADNILNII